MFRKSLIDLLLGHPLSAAQIARLAGVRVSELEADLQHLLKSLRHTDYELAVTPARCRKCGFEFETGKLTRPSRCPECRATWIREPSVQVVRRGGEPGD
jgi:hypothetical protein